MKNIRVELVKSLNKRTKRQIATVVSLGLKKIHSIATLPDNKSVRGKIDKVPHLVRIVD